MTRCHELRTNILGLFCFYISHLHYCNVIQISIIVSIKNDFLCKNFVILWNCLACLWAPLGEAKDDSNVFSSMGRDPDDTQCKVLADD